MYIHAFIDNSFLFTQGYKHVQDVASGMDSRKKKPQINYLQLKNYLAEQGELKRTVLVGSNLAGNLITNCQKAGFEVFTCPRHPDIKTGKEKEKGVDQKVCWEIAKTIFNNREGTDDKKIILCTGDKDFMTILPDIHTSGWDLEVWLWNNSFSRKFADQVQAFGTVKPLDDEWQKFIEIVDNKKKR